MVEEISRYQTDFNSTDKVKHNDGIFYDLNGEIYSGIRSAFSSVDENELDNSDMYKNKILRSYGLLIQEDNWRHEGLALSEKEVILEL